MQARERFFCNNNVFFNFIEIITTFAAAMRKQGFRVSFEREITIITEYYFCIL